jgi:hypothetical protein
MAAADATAPNDGSASSDGMADAGIEALAVGDGFSCAINAGAVYCWGLLGPLKGNSLRPLGTAVGSVSLGAQALAASSDRLCAASGSSVSCMVMLGMTMDSSTTPINGAGSVSQLALGRAHTCARTQGQQLFCWGDNTHNQIGPTTTDTVPLVATGVTQVSAGGDVTCYANPNNNGGCIGDNALDQLGTMTTNQPMQSATPIVGSLSFGKAIFGAGYGPMFNPTAMGTFGGMVCGAGTPGMTPGGCWGYDAVQVTAFPVTSYPEQISVGFDTVCYVDSDKRVFCAQQSGTPLAEDQITGGSNPVTGVVFPVAFGQADFVAVSGDHACARSIDHGHVACWGAGGYGQLGNGDSADQPTPVLVQF